MAPPEYLPAGRLVPLVVMALVWGTLAFFRMLWGIVVYGPQKFFYVKNRSRPEVLNNPELGTHHYARLKNIRLHYVSNGKEDAPLVLFLHGFPEFWYSWRYQLKEFGKDFRAVAVDMRGYSESERPQGIAQYRIDLLAADVKDLIEHLGYEKCYLVAHDWGGAVAWHFAAKYPTLVDKLIVCNCPHSAAFAKHLQKSMKQFLASWYMFYFQIPWLPEISIGTRDGQLLRQMLTSGVKSKYITDDDIDATLYTFKNFGDKTGPINYYRAMMRYKADRPASGKVKCPTLIIWGCQDKALTKELAAESKKYVEDCTLAYIENASHWVQQDEPELVNQEIRKFIS